MATKQIQVFMTAVDEAAFIEELKRHCDLRVLDDNVWASEPKIEESIADCECSHVYLWDRAVVADLPTMVRPDGRLQGPSVGPVVQFLRSRVNVKDLLSGSLAAGYDPEEKLISGFVTQVWKAVRKVCPERLRLDAPLADGEAPTPVFGVAGRDAAQQCREGRLHLKSVNTSHYFRPFGPS